VSITIVVLLLVGGLASAAVGIIGNWIMPPGLAWLRWWHLLIAVVVLCLVQTSINWLVPQSTQPTNSDSNSRTIAHSFRRDGRLEPRLTVAPTTGPPGMSFSVAGIGYSPSEQVRITLFEGAHLTTFDGPYILGDILTDSKGAFKGEFTINHEICCAGATIFVTGTGRRSHATSQVTFYLH